MRSPWTNAREITDACMVFKPYARTCIREKVWKEIHGNYMSEGARVVGKWVNSSLSQPSWVELPAQCLELVCIYPKAVTGERVLKSGM